jgi:hypothetical protein
MSPGFFVGPEIVTPSPQPSPPRGRGGKGADRGLFRTGVHLEFFRSMHLENNPVSPLSLRERARVRVLLLLGSLGIEVEHANARQQIRLRQIRMLMPAERAIHQPMAILNVKSETADEALLFVVRGNEIKAILVFSVKHVAFHVCFEARRVAHPHDDAVTQDSHRSIIR